MKAKKKGEGREGPDKDSCVNNDTKRCIPGAGWSAEARVAGRGRSDVARNVGGVQQF